MPMNKRTIRIATRKSPLALWQAETVKSALLKVDPSLDIELLKLSTQGDRFLEKPLIEIGGKGLFLKELEEALLDKRADLAVHSMKDVPAELPPALVLPTLLLREDPRDAVVSRENLSLKQLAAGSVIGTASLRRASQLKSLRPDCITRSVRGNVQTRLAKLNNGEYDAIILARAGLLRLNLADRITQTLDEDECLPAVGQGAVGVECRESDGEIRALLSKIHHQDTADCVAAERAMNRVLGGSCHVPVAGHATLKGDVIELVGLVSALDGQKRIQHQVSGDRNQAEALGESLGEYLLQHGAADIIADL